MLHNHYYLDPSCLLAETQDPPYPIIRVINKKNFLSPFLLLLVALYGCATSPPKSESSDSKKIDSQDPKQLLIEATSRVQSLETKLASLSDRVTGLDDKIQSLNDKLEATRGQAIAATPPANSNAGVLVEPTPTEADETGFVNTMAVQSYRKALLLFESQQYSEAVLAFSEFIDRNPDHPLAGSAQYYIGECYFKQNEYKLAIQEYQKVLSSYENSPHVADTLKQLTLAEEAVKRPADSQRHRELLGTLFPQSPANQTLLAEQKSAPPVQQMMGVPEHTQAAPSPRAKPSPSQLDQQPMSNGKPAETSQMSPTDQPRPEGRDLPQLDNSPDRPPTAEIITPTGASSETSPPPHP